MNRLFIALPVENKIIDYIFQKLSQEESFKLFRWEKKENIHITLKFLGDTEGNFISSIDKELEKIAIKYSSFTLKLNKLGTFNKNGNPFILWFNFNKSDTVNLLQKDLEECLSELGYNKETREFYPHVTLLRVKNEKDSQYIKKYKEIELEPVQYILNEFYLVKSELTSKGSVYTKIKTYKLK